MQKLINKIMLVIVVGFIGCSLYSFWDYKTNPVKYMVTSAPWYINVYLNAIVAVVLLMVCVIIKWFLKKRG